MKERFNLYFFRNFLVALLIYISSISASESFYLNSDVIQSSWDKAVQQLKAFPFNQPVPLAFGGGQYISSEDGQRITKGHEVRNLKKGYFRHISLDEDSGTFKIHSTKIYNITYFLSVKMVMDTTATVSQIMALKVNGKEVAWTTMSIASSTTFLDGTTLVTAIYNATATISFYLRKGDKVQLVLSKRSTSPHWGDNRVRVYANNEDLAASLFLQSQETAGT